MQNDKNLTIPHQQSWWGKLLSGVVSAEEVPLAEIRDTLAEARADIGKDRGLAPAFSEERRRLFMERVAARRPGSYSAVENAQLWQILIKPMPRKAYDMAAETLDRELLQDALKDIDAAWGTGFLDRSEPIPENGRTVMVETQPNDVSRLHKLAQALVDRTVAAMPKAEVVRAMPADVQTFVVGHDWSKLLGDETKQGDYQLPFDKCAFEFRVSGRNLIVLGQQDDTHHKPRLTAFYETKDGLWLALGDAGLSTWESFVRTICVMLEAEVAVHEVRRVPAKLQAKRATAGKLPMYDYHVLDISRRHRTTGAPGLHTGAQKRLHFCRGHWRHYPTHRVWIKWCLKGNAELGFVDKGYKI